MTLTNRLMLFFAGCIAAVLLVFSVALYWTVRDHLFHQASERLAGLEKILVAAIEFGPDGAEWEPDQRSVNGPDGGFLWQLSDEKGNVLDGVPTADELLPGFGTNSGEAIRWRRLDSSGRPWLVAHRTVRAALGPSGVAPGKHSLIDITAAVPLGPVLDTLNRLATLLAGLSFAVLIVALVVGRSVCRRALAPVAHMAAAARGMSATDLADRLPVAPVNDELADLGRSFNDLLDRLHESFERQRRFTGDASHQLRTPLAAILGQADVALRRDRPAAEYRQALATVREQASHLTGIVEALLFLARLEAEAGPPTAERLDLTSWLPEHLQSWADHPRASDIHADMKDADPARVQVPPALLGELFNNLLDNALKYSEPGSPVTTRLRRRENAVTLAIEDRGDGIDSKDLSNLFRPFFRSADTRRRGIPGVGLGLAIAARLAKAFGGDISVTSEPGQGSCFTVRLPAA